MINIFYGIFCKTTHATETLMPPVSDSDEDKSYATQVVRANRWPNLLKRHLANRISKHPCPNNS
jgi:hypothetical protein